MIQPVEDRLGHDFRYAVDLGKIRRLGFKPEWTFEKALRHTTDWYQKNPDWWQPLKRDRYTVK